LLSDLAGLQKWTSPGYLAPMTGQSIIGALLVTITTKIASSFIIYYYVDVYTFSVLTLLVGWQEGHPACTKLEWWGAGVVICLERGADLHPADATATHCLFF